MRWGLSALRWHMMLVFFVVAAICPAGEAAEDRSLPVCPLKIEKPLLAHWRFDEQSGSACLDSSGNGCDASCDAARAAGLQRAQGVFGNAMRLSGQHHLRVPGRPVLGMLQKLSFSAWVMPIEMGVYREIFRKEDGDLRVLFSFQNKFFSRDYPKYIL